MKPAELSFRDSGGPGEAVVLVHAIGTDHRMWDDVFARLSGRWRVIAPDVRGHGASPVPPRPYTLEALADDVAALLDRLRVKKAHWVGLSMGGMIGQAFALAHAGRLGSLVLANTTSSYGAEGRAMWRTRIRLVEEGGLAAIRELVMQRYFSDAFRTRHPKVVAAVASGFLATPVRGYLGCCDALAGLDYTARLAAVKAPTLVIAGDLDAGTPPAMGRAIAEAIPGARLAVIEGASHLSAVEKPAEFGTLVEEFLASVRSRGGDERA